MAKEKVKEIIERYLDSLIDGTLINFVSINFYDKDNKCCSLKIDYDA